MKKSLITGSIVIIAAIAAWYMSQPGFWSVTEVSQPSSASAVWQDYASPTYGFSIKVPPGYTSDESYKYEALGPGREITGVSFTVPASLKAGTNLSQDSYISVERLRDVACVPSDFLDGVTTGQKMTLEDAVYTFASSSGAGAGNRYEEGVYMRPVGAYCYGVRLFMHSGAIYNYDPGTVREFDREALVRTFQLMASTAVFRP